MNCRFPAFAVASCLLAAVAIPRPAAASGPDATPWYENVSLFAGLDGSKQPQDLGINANMGARFAADAGVPVWRRGGLGLHVGGAANFSDAAVHVLDQIEGTSRRAQYFASVGLYQSTSAGFRWAAGYDFQYEDYFDTFRLGQVRGQAGMRVSKRDELGVWFAKSVQGDDGVMGDTPVRLEPISQVNAYLRHTWPSMAWTSVWAGMAAGHDNVVWVLPPDTRNENVLVYGAELHMPLSERFAVTGAANFLTPTATGTVDAHLGLTYYPGGHVLEGDSNRLAPVVTSANNATFPVDLTR